MKRGILLLLTLLLLLPAAALADMDNDLLESTEGMLVYLDNDQINTIIRPENQPFEGEVDMPYAGWSRRSPSTPASCASPSAAPPTASRWRRSSANTT